jgi:hypothetical protein
MIETNLSLLTPTKDIYGNILIVLNSQHTLKLDREAALDLAHRLVNVCKNENE